MATAMLTPERGLRRKLTQEEPRPRAPKRKSTPKSRQHQQQQEQNNNVKRQRTSSTLDPKTDMLGIYQPWVIQTYGDLAKTKTITIKKYARILRTLRGEEVVSADNSKFRFWVKAKGFYVGKPPGYDAKPADAIVGRYSVCDSDTGIPSLGDKLTGSAKDPPLYVPNAPFKNANGEPVYRKVAVVENFFDIIYNVHVELEGRPGKHAGQKRTYRTITETYAFLPREAVTRFLLGCTECQRRPRSPSPAQLPPTKIQPTPIPPSIPTTPAPATPQPANVLPTPSPSPTLSLPPAATPRALTDIGPAAPPPGLPAVEAQPPLDYYGLPIAGAKDKDSHHRVIQHHGTSWEVSEKLDISQSQTKIEGPLRTSTPEPPPPPTPTQTKRSSNPLDVCNLTSRNSPSPPKICTPPKKRHLNHLSDGNNREKEHHPPTPKLWSPVDSLGTDQSRTRTGFPDGEIDYSLPITTTYLKYMRSLGCTDEDALKFEKTENTSTPEPSEPTDEDQFTGAGGVMKDSDKLKLMLLAWNYHNQTQGGRNGGEVPDLSALGSSEDVANLWASYNSALGLAKGKATPPAPREQSSPVLAETGSAHDETSSSGNKEDEDDDDDESDDRIDTQQYDPERLKAFNMFVRLFVDENLDRMVPISKQPKEKIQAIIDSCTRQFPEFAERARKRIRTYLKSCRRNKRARDPSAPWDATRPTPAHLTSVQAEQILATACENESHNAKRMRLGLEPISQPMPVLPGTTTTDTTATIGQTRSLDFANTGTVKVENTDTNIVTFPSSTTPTSTAATKPLQVNQDNKNNICVSTGITSTPMNGLGIASSAGTAPTAMYRPNFTQAFQRAGPYPALFPGQPFNATSGMLTNGPTDLSMKQKPLLSHKLSAGEMAAVRQLITGYRESAAFLLRSADELEQLLLQQQ